VPSRADEDPQPDSYDGQGPDEVPDRLIEDPHPDEEEERAEKDEKDARPDVLEIVAEEDGDADEDEDDGPIVPDEVAEIQASHLVEQEEDAQDDE
jgi:hypothetical protein